eukprot:TRINITY_DN29444_c0_g1_i1.p1 TRINITY_DN29444_c0_g1~~TRINITY_DN29444_c0_g1_i1.p1  ORF type:complete len:155 (+),score=16.17 TRINITY_DN29444_c0_g1_i1:14-478(+)
MGVLPVADRDFTMIVECKQSGQVLELWNLPVHRWCVRHLSNLSFRLGNSKTNATLVVFFTSAFFHEYLISVPLRLFKVWGFLGMLAQAPLFPVSMLIEKKLGPRMGNVFVWVSLILGQPLAVMMYYHDYVVDHFGQEEIQAFGDLDTFRNSTSV